MGSDGRGFDVEIRELSKKNQQAGQRQLRNGLLLDEFRRLFRGRTRQTGTVANLHAPGYEIRSIPDDLRQAPRSEGSSGYAEMVQ